MLRVLAVFMLLLPLVGCGETAERVASTPSPVARVCVPEPTETPRLAGTTSCTMEGSVEVEVSGAQEFSYEGASTLAINEFYQGDLPQTTWFANLGMATPTWLTETTSYRVLFDIAPGTYRGPGTYTLTPERPEVEGLSSPLTDKAVLEYTSLGPDTPPQLLIFGGMVEPCALEIADTLTRGQLSCPRLVDESGAEIALDFRWEPA